MGLLTNFLKMNQRDAQATLTRGVGAGNEQNREDIEDEHQREEGSRFSIRARKFLPSENSPERCDHGCRLTDCVRNRHAGKVRGNGEKDQAGGPYRAAQQAQQMASRRPVEESAEGHWLSLQWMLHQIRVPDEAGKECTEREE